MTAQLQDEDEATPLQRRLARMIRAQGPISVADYMSDALGHPQEGYYMARDPIGAEGDFTTAPEISQMFGELIGAFLVQSWIDMGEPSLFNLIE
ncbi:MAG: class I SAM-dependent methyltransferase, partial [Pseudomonadota bacterium]